MTNAVGAGLYDPALASGFKIHPQHIRGLLGLPHVGNIWYVDPTNGSDSGGGKKQTDALKTIVTALSKATANNHDVILVAPDGGTGRTAETAVITWNKRFTHLIGSAAPVHINTRAGFSMGASVSPGINISENGCIFANMTWATFQDNNILATVTGNRNRFHNIHFAGIGHATAGDDTAARCLYLNGGQENLFTNCTFGLDTVMRSTTNATIELASSASRNFFESCLFQMAADNVGPNHLLLTGSSAIDRWLWFNNCHFYSFWTNDTDKITHAFDLAAQTATGHVMVTGHYSLTGADDWEATASGKLYVQRFGETAGTVGLTVNPTV